MLKNIKNINNNIKISQKPININNNYNNKNTKINKPQKLLNSQVDVNKLQFSYSDIQKLISQLQTNSFSKNKQEILLGLVVPYNRNISMTNVTTNSMKLLN